MKSIAIWTLGIRAFKPRASIFGYHRCFHQTCRTLLVDTAPFDPWAQPGPDRSALDSRSLAKRAKWDELMDSLSRDRPNPSRVWNGYIELGSVMGFDEFPFEIQQQVLRKCVPRASQLRVSAARRMRAGNMPKVPHIYESRLQTLIGHMRASGRKPRLEEYNFILEQFAAVGHHHGARQVFQELTHLGVEPSYRTYGHCLQAIAHRLTLPCPFRFQSSMMHEANTMCTELLDDMWSRRVPLTSVNFDLVLRVFKETSGRQTFEKLIHVGYGIDLAHPDRPPLEVQGPEILTGRKAVHMGHFKQLPFTTAALNTLIDMLGKTKQISRMVMAFEVFTSPIPSTASGPVSDQGYVDEDDEDDPAFYQFSSPDGGPSQFRPPAAVPNTTSFNLLIRYAAKANHAVFARHYVVQAMERDREVDARLREDLASKPLEQIASPNFSVNRGTLLPPFGLANRTKHFAFMRWGWKQASLALDRKKEGLAFYSEWQQKRLRNLKSHALDDVAHVDAGSMVGTVSSSNTPDALPVSPITPPPSHTPPVPQIPDVLLVDLDAPPQPAPAKKQLDLDLHISLLARDVEELDALVNRQRIAVRRLSQRVKERLGRRVWQGKDIFLMHENKRVLVDRSTWARMVRFRHPRPDQVWRPVRPRTDGRRGRQEAPHIRPHNQRTEEYAPD